MAFSRSAPSQTFISKKRKILDQLTVPASEYEDLSPKGSIDVGIRDLIDEINRSEEWVTTSSCAGRLSIFLEGEKCQDMEEQIEQDVEKGKRNEEVTTKAGIGGKGGGGRWLYVSHDPLDRTKLSRNLAEFLGLERKSLELQRLTVAGEPDCKRWVHFKFEPMILHILTASPQQAQIILSAALQAGFRESGAINLTSSNTVLATPMVAVRSMGLSLESIIGCAVADSRYPLCIVPEETLECLIDLANERFKENKRRTERFRSLLKELSSVRSIEPRRRGQEGDEWEDPQRRRERKKADGLVRSQQRKDNTTLVKTELGVIVEPQSLGEDD